MVDGLALVLVGGDDVMMLVVRMRGFAWADEAGCGLGDLAEGAER